MNTEPRSSYQEQHAPAPLRDRLVCFWTRTIAAGERYAQAVLPDGCVDIVWMDSSAPVVAGPATRPMIVDLPSGANVVGVRFKPGWASSSLGMPVDELLNTLHVPLADLGIGRAEDLANLSSALDQASFNEAHLTELKLAALTQWVLQLCANRQLADPAIQFAVKRLASPQSGIAAVAALEREVGWSARHLQRRFRAAVGYAPKTFQRIMRLQRLLWLTSRTKGSRSLAELAMTAGYSDQAHMCREVRDFTGATPQSVLARPGSTVALSDLFNTTEAGAS
jgi:AraC-like DNA-binding protein